MIFADKVIKLRKKNGWSQEELANQLDVSRQSVSKWESAQSVPELSKIIKLSKLFNVSTDYLLKDELEEPEEEKTPRPCGSAETKTDDDEALKMTIGDVTKYFRTTNITTMLLSGALAVMLIIPTIVSLCFYLQDYGLVSVTIAGVLLAACIITLMVVYSFDKKYVPLKIQHVELEYGGAGIAEKNLEQHGKKYRVIRTVGIVLLAAGGITALCAVLLSVISQNSENYQLGYMEHQIMWHFTDIVLAAGAFCTSFSIARLNNIYCILEEGRYSPKNKKRNTGIRLFSMIYLGLYAASIVFLMTLNQTLAFLVCVIGLVIYAVVYASLVSSLIKRGNLDG